MKLTFLLSYPDSNQDKQNQNLLCYHYTIGQSSLCSLLKSVAKVCIKCVNAKFFVNNVFLYVDFRSFWAIPVCLPYIK